MPKQLSTDDAWHYLSSKVSHDPRDLLSLTRRVTLCLDRGLQERLPDALHDLFDSLGDCGLALRQHMLEQSRPQLAPEHREFFDRWLTERHRPATESLRFERNLVQRSLRPAMLPTSPGRA
ncbi:MAG: hypothetical protein CSB44_10505 [Gammaproteobacteria bacterium]|nr:MAG: hypothetical protein CSB44_10505 [Gammaproteobacteria bacterium]